MAALVNRNDAHSNPLRHRSMVSSSSAHTVLSKSIPRKSHEPGLLAHRALERLGECLLVLAELGVGQGASALVRVTMFPPHQHQRHALAAQLDVHASEVDFDSPDVGGAATEQPAFERGFVQLSGGLPVQPGGGPSTGRQPPSSGHKNYAITVTKRWVTLPNSAVTMPKRPVMLGRNTRPANSITMRRRCGRWVGARRRSRRGATSIQRVIETTCSSWRSVPPVGSSSR